MIHLQPRRLPLTEADITYLIVYQTDDGSPGTDTELAFCKTLAEVSATITELQKSAFFDSISSVYELGREIPLEELP